MSCSCGKVAHDTFDLALMHLRELRRQGKRKKGHVLSVYHCPQSPTKWHVGHQSTRVNRRIRRRKAERHGNTS